MLSGAVDGSWAGTEATERERGREQERVGREREPERDRQRERRGHGARARARTLVSRARAIQDDEGAAYKRAAFERGGRVERHTCVRWLEWRWLATGRVAVASGKERCAVGPGGRWIHARHQLFFRKRLHTHPKKSQSQDSLTKNSDFGKSVHSQANTSQHTLANRPHNDPTPQPLLGRRRRGGTTCASAKWSSIFRR